MWLKKFRSGCKNLHDQARPCEYKTVDSETLLQAIPETPATDTLANLVFNGLVLFVIFITSAKAPGAAQLYRFKNIENFWLTLENCSFPVSGSYRVKK